MNKYRTVATDQKISTQAVRYFRWRAERFAREYPPLIDSYHLRIEKVGFCKYAVVAYQNIMRPATKGTPDGGQ